MAVIKPKTRMVSFRLSEEDYRDLYRICSAKGAHSLSQFARETIRLRIGKRLNSPTERVQVRLGQLNGTIRDLKQEVYRLNQLIGTLHA